MHTRKVPYKHRCYLGLVELLVVSVAHLQVPQRRVVGLGG